MRSSITITTINNIIGEYFSKKFICNPFRFEAFNIWCNYKHPELEHEDICIIHEEISRMRALRIIENAENIE